MIGTYERAAQRLISKQPKPAPYCWFDGKKLHRGTQSLHRTAASRMWRTFWRMKQ